MIAGAADAGDAAAPSPPSPPSPVDDGPAIEFIAVGRDGCTVTTDVPTTLPANGFLWIDAHAGRGRAWAEAVRQLTGVEIFEEHLLDSENAAHPSFFDATAHYEMIIMRALGPRPAPSPNRIRILTRPAVFFVLPRCLVTIRPADSHLVPAIRERLLAAARYNQRIPAQPGELLLRLLSGLVDRYLDLRQPLTEQLETWQRNLLHPRRPFRDWPALLEARMELRKLQHLCEEQLDAVQEWRDERIEHAEPGDGAALPPINEALAVRTADLVNHIQRVLSHARGLESSVESAVQLHFSATAFRTAEIMRVLTVLTATFMPLTLITGIFGMNFENLPGTRAPQAFWITIGAMTLLAMIMLGWFLTQRYLGTPDRLARRLPSTIARRVADETGPTGPTGAGAR